MTRPNSRPVFLDLLRIRMPVTAVTSIGHRLSGVLLFVLLPLFLYLFELSLRDPASFDTARALLSAWPLRLLGVFTLWWFVHHLLAGIRLLLADLEWGTDLPQARRSAWAVNLAGAAVLIAGALILL